MARFRTGNVEKNIGTVEEKMKRYKLRKKTNNRVEEKVEDIIGFRKRSEVNVKKKWRHRKTIEINLAT